jgi:hypothetical protein
LIFFSQTQKDLYDIFHEEEKYWQLRSKIQLLQAGDSNTNFFHQVTSARYRKNLIHSLCVDGVEIRDSVLIQDHILGYFKDIFSEGYYLGVFGFECLG